MNSPRKNVCGSRTLVSGVLSYDSADARGELSGPTPLPFVPPARAGLPSVSLFPAGSASPLTSDDTLATSAALFVTGAASPLTRGASLAVTSSLFAAGDASPAAGVSSLAGKSAPLATRVASLATRVASLATRVASPAKSVASLGRKSDGFGAADSPYFTKNEGFEQKSGVFNLSPLLPEPFYA